MSERIFENPYNVPAAILNIRLRKFDPSGSVRTYDASKVDVVGNVIGVTHYAAVDSTLTDAQIESGMGAMTQAEIDAQSRFYAARETANLSTLLKTMTAQQAENYINNVTTLAQAKVVMIELSKLVITLRDTIWQDMQGN
jgi:hypothetical protein